jgi:hypothetical protein
LLAELTWAFTGNSFTSSDRVAEEPYPPRRHPGGSGAFPPLTW